MSTTRPPHVCPPELSAPIRPGRRRWPLAAILIGLAPLLLSCSRDQQQAPDDSSSAVTTAAGDLAESSGPRAVIDLDSVGLVDQQLHVEPSKQGWDSEIINDSADQQLKALGKLLEHPEQLDAAHIAPIVDADYQSGPLRVSELTTVLDDSSLLVRRASLDRQTGPSDASTYRGHRGFAEAMRDLLRPLPHGIDVRSKFKIIRVEVTKNEATTENYFELSGRTEAGIVQQRAMWTCRWRRQSDQPPRLMSIAVAQYEEVAGKTPGRTLFTDCTEVVLGQEPAYREQLAYSTDYWLDRLEIRYGIDPGAWVGLALGDVNGDDLDDVFVCQPGGLPNRLFFQQSDGTAMEASADAGVDWLDHTHGALLVDLDNDSDQDLVLAMKSGLIFMSGDGKGHFELAATKLSPDASPYALSAADFDNDGDLDVYACCYSMRKSDTERRFIQRPVPYHDANNGGRNVLYRNDGQWRFQNVTKLVGLDQNNRRYSFASSWDDYDNDGDLDLYVANDYGRNSLYRNDGGRFADVAPTAGVEDISAGMSVSWGDYNNDGWMDIYVSNMFSSAGNRIAYQRRFHADANEKTRSEFQRHARGNSLFQNMGDGTFRDVSQPAGVTMGRWAWGSHFMDMNNDGREDLVVANGFITQDDTGDL